MHVKLVKQLKMLHITTWGRNGLVDWLAQRLTALWIGAYTIFILGFLVAHPHLTYTQWQTLFSHLGMRFFTLGALLSVLIHAWIGLWIVLTDYVKCPRLRLGLTLSLIFLLLWYLFWAVSILYG